MFLSICFAARTCSNPGRPVFGYISPDLPSYSVNAEVTYACDVGYVLRGSVYAVCERSGRFTEAPPTCKREILNYFFTESIYFISVIDI